MKKDAVYSMRMSSRVREALKKAARKERRTVASLLDKIIIEYLSQEGHINLDAERRNFSRTRITLPAKSIVRQGRRKI
ncbi:MAG: Arc family DNA-binding protein [Desulfobacterales bacterium]